MSGDHHRAFEFAAHAGPASQASKLFLRNMESSSLCSDSSVFSVQMWKAAGLTPKVLGGKRPADGGTPSATPQSRSGHHQQHFARSGLSSNSYSGFSELNPKSLKAAAIQAYETSVVEESAAQLSGSTGHSPAPKGADRGERDPISSTPRHGSGAHNHQHGAFGDPVASAEAALAAQQRQVQQLARQLQRCTSAGQVATSGPGIAPDARPCLICGISCHVYVTVPGISAPLAPQPSVAASATAAVGAALAQVSADSQVPAGDVKAAPALASAGHSLPAAAAGPLQRPLQHAASAPAVPEAPSGPPPLIGCSQCRKPMHLDCFVAHYNVVPARRDYTYCPAHVYVPKPKQPGGGERKLAPTSHGGGGGGGGHKRERGDREGGERKKKRRAERPASPEEDYDDGDGDYVPRATTMRLRGTSPAPAPRRNAGARLRTRSSSNGGIATALTAAAAGSAANGTAAGGTTAAVPNGDTDASDGGGGGGGGAGGMRHAPRAKHEPGEPHESRSGSPVDRAAPSGRGDDDGQQQQAQQDEAAAQPWPADGGGAGNAVSIGERLGSGGGSSVSGELQRPEGQEGNPARSLSHPGDGLEGGIDRVIRVPKHQRSARTPRAAPAPVVPGGYPRKASSLAVQADSENDAPATPRSPSKGERGRDGGGGRTPRARAAAGNDYSGFSGGEERRDNRPADKTVRRGSGGGESAGRDSDAGGKAAAAALRTAASGSLDGRPSSHRDHHPASSREQQPHSPRGGSGGAAARSSLKSPVKSPRPRDGSAGKGDRAARPGSAQAAAEMATPPPAPVVPAELKDEELARLLHEELNAPSRRRAAKRPGLPDAFTTPPLSPLNSLTPLSSSGGGGSSAKKQATADRARPVSATGTPVVNGSAAAPAGPAGGGQRPVTPATP